MNDDVNPKLPRHHTLRKITYSGVFAALVLIATQLKIPVGNGYVHLGDGLVLATGYVLGPMGFFAAAIGSALADLLAGYAIYIPATFFIKGAMALVTGLLLYKSKPSVLRSGIVFALAQCIMVAGYFVYEIFLYGLEAAALAIPPNLGQAAAGVLIALLLTPLLKRLKIQ